MALLASHGRADTVEELRAQLQKEAENAADSMAKISDAISHVVSGLTRTCDDDPSRRAAICKGITRVTVTHSPGATTATVKKTQLVVSSGAGSFTDYEAVTLAAVAVSSGVEPEAISRPSRPATTPGPDAEGRKEFDDDADRLSGLLLESCGCPITITIDWSFQMTPELRTPLGDVLAQIYNGVSSACPEATIGSPASAVEEAKAAKKKVCARLSRFVVRHTDTRTGPALDGTTMTVSFDTQRIYDVYEISRPVQALVAAPFSGKAGGGGAPLKGGGAMAGTNGPNGWLEDVSGVVVWLEAADGSGSSIWVNGKKVADEAFDERRASVVRGNVPDGTAKVANSRLGVVGSATFKKNARHGPTVSVVVGEVSKILDFDRGALTRERRFHVGLGSDKTEKVEGGHRGPLSWEGSYVDGQLEGAVKTFWQNGSLSRQDSYRRGKEVGERRFFDLKGKPISGAEWSRLQNAAPPPSGARPTEDPRWGRTCSSDTDCGGLKCKYGSTTVGNNRKVGTCR